MTKIGVTLIFALAVWAQPQNEKNTPSRPPRPPDYVDIRYGPFVRNDLDLYLAKSTRPAPLVLYFFPGGFRVGNKNTVPPPLLDACSEAGFTVAACNYRYVTDAPFPASFLDAARALQFLRLHAREYNIDPRRVAATGASAGADIALWLGFHDDLADAPAADPVARQSTRICAVGAQDVQTTLDVREIARLITPEDAHNPMWAGMYGLKPEEMDTGEAHRRFAAVSAASLLTKNAAPVFLYYWAPHKPITLEMPRVERVHNPAFGFYLKERMDKLGVECVLRQRENYKTANPAPAMNREMVEFFRRKFPE